MISGPSLEVVGVGDLVDGFGCGWLVGWDGLMSWKVHAVRALGRFFHLFIYSSITAKQSKALFFRFVSEQQQR
jgi:hypothetical protein